MLSLPKSEEGSDAFLKPREFFLVSVLFLTHSLIHLTDDDYRERVSNLAQALLTLGSVPSSTSSF